VKRPGGLFAKVAVTKSHRLGGLNNRHLLSHDSGGWKSKIKVSVGLGLSKLSVLGL
jgi:hypothetical protein